MKGFKNSDFIILGDLTVELNIATLNLEDTLHLEFQWIKE